MADNKIEQYLIQMMLTNEQVDKNVWLLEDEDQCLQGVAIMYAEPLVVIRVEIMDVPNKDVQELYTKLLELNATDIIHGAYALDNENQKIVLIDTLQYDTMDFDDFRAVLESFSLVLVDHYPVLSKFREKSEGV